ncbi:HAD-IB family hydrolase [Antrihabitans sp. YC2-6]|uniref:HAD-IB family hydrolase n=1 Tax=Antrihabitans sp. YC2-6 TaxID=2799498 RepID=UPI0027DB039E|nr:HAD-IB family hydrolase [Antrihabitans sp. YC2-6]
MDLDLMELDDALTRIRSGPQGPTVGAFFDFDGTIVHGFSGVPFFRHFVRAGRLTAREVAATMMSGIRGGKTEADFARFIDLALAGWRGYTEAELDAIGSRLFEKRIAGHLYPEAWQLIRAHERAGHTLAIASSATRFQIEPTARAIGIQRVLCTQLEVEDGVLTGRVTDRPMWRSGKAMAVKDYAAESGLDLASSYAYSNGGEDVGFLALVGTPTAVNPDRVLSGAAAENNWPILRFKPRGNTGPIRAARTVGFFAGFAGGVAAAAAGGVKTRDHIRTRDKILANTGDYPLKLAGIDVSISGAHNAVEPRPAVFIFNHQSELDMFVLAKVLRGGFTGISKKEVATNPVFGPLFRYMGATFIDRQNTEKAKAALLPVVETLKGGLSIVISPEGTRSLTPTLGPFKKGAFHIAIQAGVPLIPIVIRNAGEMLWRNGTALRSGTVDVAVLDPIDVTGWDPDDLNENVDTVRQLFVDTLANWPAK